MRSSWAANRQHYFPALPGTLAVMGIGIFIYFALGLFWGSAYIPWWKSYGPYIDAGYIWVALLLAYFAWVWLNVRTRVTDAGAPGFLVAALGADLKVWGDFLWVLPDPYHVHAQLGYEPLTGAKGFAPNHLPYIIGIARNVGFAAVVLGLALALAFAIVDLRGSR